MTMSARIEVGEVLSFRLKVPKAELERLAQRAPTPVPDVGEAPGIPGLPTLLVEHEGSEWVLSVEEGDSILRFRAIGTEAVLTEVVLCNDDQGLFFTRLLGPLMVKYGGDLSARLTWNIAERNTQGDFAEVKIVRGRSNLPELGTAQPAPAKATAPTTSATALPQSAGENVMSASGAGAGAGSEVPEVQEVQLTPEQREVQAILERARGHWEEYQRLKLAAAKGGK